MDTRQLFQCFIAFCRRHGHSHHTIRAYEGDLNDFQKWLSSRPSQRLDGTVLEGWLREMRSRKYAPVTIKRKFATLKITFNWIEEHKNITENPFHSFKLKIKLPQKLPMALGRTELAALFRQAEQDAQNGAKLSKKTMWLALELLFATGVRVGELCGITLQDIDNNGEIIRVFGKGSRERQVFIVDNNTLLLINNYIEFHPLYSNGTNTLLLTNRGSAATPDFIRRNLHNLAKRAQIKRRVTPHMLRHSSATQLLERGVDIRYVQRLLGHSSISTTELYTLVSDSSLKSCLKNANPRARLNTR